MKLNTLASAYRNSWDAIRKGYYRLAGGVYRKIDPTALHNLRDVEDQHAFHRLYWAIDLARIGTTDSQALDLLIKELGEWLKSDWSKDATIDQPYTVSERIASLSEVLFWAGAAGFSSGLPVIEIKRRIWKDAMHLSTRIEFWLGIHNHILNNARALFIASATVSEANESSALEDQAFALWETYFPQLVLEDGTFAEQSSHYHLLLCRTALEYWIASKRTNRQIPVDFESRLRAMFRLANDLVRPDGSLARFGDVSPDHSADDLLGLLAAAYAHKILDTPPRCGIATPLTLYYCGDSCELSQSSPGAEIELYEKGGFAFLRNPSGFELVAHADPRSEVRAHGDAGRGSFELSWRDQVVIKEPGSILSHSDPLSVWSGSGGAQNVTILNGLAPAVTREDRQFLPAWYLPRGGSWTVLENGAARFRCDSFQRLRDGIVLDRTWKIEDTTHLVFEEQIDGSGEVEFESRLCLGNQPWEAPVKDHENETWRMKIKGSPIEITVRPPSGTKVAIQSNPYVVEYGQWEEGKWLLLEGRQQLPLKWQLRCEINEGESN